MVYNYCTLFDSLYLSRALAMYESLQQQCPNFHLYIFPFDTKSEQILRKLNLQNVSMVPLSDFEDEELLRVKKSRTKGEYCWTCTPSTIYYCIQKFNLDHCTYIDADLYFFSDPNCLIDEMGDKSVLITEHRYSKQYDRSLAHGIYCVQFITFKNTLDGLAALTWWRDRCLEWCYSRLEDGKFGDQKYLDDWSTRFKGIHVLQHLGGGVAPWNVQQYAITSENNQIRVHAEGSSHNLVFYHFHYVKFYDNQRVDLGSFELSDEVKKLYKSYLIQINSIEIKLKQNFAFEKVIQKYIYKNRVLTLAHKVYRMVRGAYHVENLAEFRDGKID